MEERQQPGEGQVRRAHPDPGHVGAGRRLAGREQHRRGPGGAELLPVPGVPVERELARAGLLEGCQAADAQPPVPLDGTAHVGGELCQGAFHPPPPSTYFFLAGVATGAALLPLTLF